MSATLPPTTATRGALLSRLHKVEGQIRGVQRMVGHGERCNDVLVQIAAARGALTTISLELIACELDRVVADDDHHRRAAMAFDVRTAIGRVAHR